MKWTAVKHTDGTSTWLVMAGKKIIARIENDQDNHGLEELRAGFIADAFNSCSEVSSESPYRIARWIPSLYLAAKTAMHFIRYCMDHGNKEPECLQAHELLDSVITKMEEA